MRMVCLSETRLIRVWLNFVLSASDGRHGAALKALARGDKTDSE